MLIDTKKVWSVTLSFILFSTFTYAESVLRLKTRNISSDPAARVVQVDTHRPSNSQHLILQFNDAPTADTISALAALGVSVLQFVPENGLLVTINGPVALDGLGVRYAAPLDDMDKVSPLISSHRNGYFLVELHPDVDVAYARGLFLSLGLELNDNPDLGPHQLMIHEGNPRRIAGDIATITAQDETAYVFPASDELAAGTPVRACAGAITTVGSVGQFTPTYGSGWGGPGINAATISYVFSTLSTALPAGSTKSEIERAMAEWSKVAKITWQPGSNPNGPRTVNIEFASGAHGDGFPFSGPTGVIAHTFYPAPTNPEPIAGDMHLNADVSWHIGANTDLYSVALHELGHALGLGHSDNPNDVMYPYYKMVTTLSPGDKATILTLYAAQTSTPAPAVGPTPAPPLPVPTPAPAPTPTPTPTSGGKDTTPPMLTITSPGGSTVSTSVGTVTFSGTASDNVAVASVSWSTNTGSSGTATGLASWSAAVPLLVGSNQVTIRATDTAGNIAWRSVVVARQ